MMVGSEADFIKRLVDNSPHITIVDEFRVPKKQALEKVYLNSLTKLNNITPLNEPRGVRKYREIIEFVKSKTNVNVSASLVGQVLVNYAGKDYGLTANGLNPAEIKGITTIEKYMQIGSVDNLIANPDGIIIGQDLANRLMVNINDVISLVSSSENKKRFKIVGLFKTGRSNFDETQVFLDLVKAQALLNKNRRANRVLVKLDTPYLARDLALEIEKNFSFKSISWQEVSEDILNTLMIRNTIMYTVVSAILIVAAFGIYNVISTVVKEKYRDIAILKSIGFKASDIKIIFVIQGLVLGTTGCIIGVPLGTLFMYGLMQIRLKPPGASEIINLPIDWGYPQFLIAICFALFSSLLAAYLPARHAGNLKPVNILRGGW
jgi:lipoprotein-releasing system permease protein